MDVISAIRTTSMGRYQWFVLASLACLTIIDGFELLLMSYVLPYFPKDFASTTQKGWLISAGLFGMAVGASVIGPMADRFGRRRLVIIGMIANFLGMAISSVAPHYTWLMAGRFFTGLAVGTIAVCVVVLIQEFSSFRQRNLAMGINASGLPLGGMIAGFASVAAINAFDSWRYIFAIGAVLSFLILILAIAVVPESLEYLFARDTQDSREQIAKTIARLGKTEIDPDALPAISTPTGDGNRSEGVRGILSGSLRQRTFLIWLTYSLLVAGFYFVVNWTPQLVANSTGDPARGAWAGTVMSLSGVVAALVFAVIGMLVPAPRIAWIAVLLCSVSMLGLGVASGVEWLTLAMTVTVGLTAYLAISANNAMIPAMYPSKVRATGYGWALGVSRTSAILFPALVGWALTYVDSSVFYNLASLLLFISALVTYLLWRMTKPELEAEKHGKILLEDVSTDSTSV